MSNIQQNKALIIWHYSVLFLLILLVSVGGFTRLTNSGLSITNWDIFKGILPPLNNSKWEEYFSLYKSIPQYKVLNYGMSLAEFKYIFWWEYIHRLLARFVSLVYFIPLLFFIIKKNINKKNIIYYLFIFLLFLFQGFLGWFMVKSGLSVNTDVSHFRLAAHLFMAIVIISLIYWSTINLNNQDLSISFSKTSVLFLIFLFLVYFQIIFGAFTSGLDAGLIYQTWPYMNNSFIPNYITTNTFFSSLAFYDQSHVQLIHRLNAYIIFVLFIFIYFFNLKRKNQYIYNLNIVFLFLVIQIVLGIYTLISGLNIYIAALHQLTSILLVMSILSLIYRVKL